MNAHPAIRQWPASDDDKLPIALWSAEEIAAATGGTASGDFACSGVEIDSRDVTEAGNGVYTLSEPGYGSLFITYQASFFKYRVFYHMPDNKYYYEVLEAENKLQWLTNRKELPFRDLTVVCSYQSYQTTVSLNRELMDWNFNNSAGIDGESLGEFTGGAEKTQGDCTVRYTDPADATAYIDVKYYKKYFFKDSNGRTLTLLFPNCT